MDMRQSLLDSSIHMSDSSIHMSVCDQTGTTLLITKLSTTELTHVETVEMKCTSSQISQLKNMCQKLVPKLNKKNKKPFFYNYSDLYNFFYNYGGPPLPPLPP